VGSSWEKIRELQQFKSGISKKLTAHAEVLSLLCVEVTLRTRQSFALFILESLPFNVIITETDLAPET
jgi:hypothetical protein